MGAFRRDEPQIILGAAVVDDVLALVVLGTVTVWATTGQISTVQEGIAIISLVLKTVGFLSPAILLGVKLTPGWFRRAANLRLKGALLAVGLAFCFSWTAELILPGLTRKL